jgi:hypothetical protein
MGGPVRWLLGAVVLMAVATLLVLTDMRAHRHARSNTSTRTPMRTISTSTPHRMAGSRIRTGIAICP